MPTIQVQLDELIPDSDNVRAGSYDTDSSIAELARSMDYFGQLQPIRVAKTTDGKYQIIAGHRRYFAAKLAKIPKLTAEVVKGKRDRDMTTAEMLVENMQRVNLNPAEKHDGIMALASEHGWSKKEISTRLGLSTKTINSRVSWNKLPDKTLDAIRKGKYSIEDANTLARCTIAQIEELTKPTATPMGHMVRAMVDKTTRLKKQDTIRSKVQASVAHVITKKQYEKTVDAHAKGGEINIDDPGVAALSSMLIGHDGKVRVQYIYIDDMPAAVDNADATAIFYEQLTEYSSQWYLIRPHLAADTNDPIVPIDDYSRDMDAWRAVHELAKAELDGRERAAEDVLLNMTPAQQLVKAIMHSILQCHSPRRVLDRLGLVVDDTEIKALTKQLVDYASANKTQMSKAFMASQIVAHPPIDNDADIDDIVFPSRPQYGHYEDGRKLTEAELEAKYPPKEQDDETDED